MNASEHRLERFANRCRSHRYCAVPPAHPPTAQQFEFSAIRRHDPIRTLYQPRLLGPARDPKYAK
jgi:hypothetical protein